MKLFMSSLVPLNMNIALSLRFLAAGVPSVSQFLNFALSSRDLTSVHESPFSL